MILCKWQRGRKHTRILRLLRTPRILIRILSMRGWRRRRRSRHCIIIMQQKRIKWWRWRHRITWIRIRVWHRQRRSNARRWTNDQHTHTHNTTENMRTRKTTVDTSIHTTANTTTTKTTTKNDTHNNITEKKPEMETTTCKTYKKTHTYTTHDTSDWW